MGISLDPTRPRPSAAEECDSVQPPAIAAAAAAHPQHINYSPAHGVGLGVLCVEDRRPSFNTRPTVSAIIP
ncbi:hypothetical protein RB195_008002 [Necator americanus]|uniref:Uncharacterized protein n=1 Tax=Necator americanus TaxID=51031 RepID=A0ABR1C2A9_NECAM